MSTTTKYANWASIFSTLDPEGDVANYAGEYGDDYDLGAIGADYRAAIGALLPGSLVLVGSEFIGDVHDGQVPETWADDLKEQINDADFEARFAGWFEAHEVKSGDRLTDEASGLISEGVSENYQDRQGHMGTKDFFVAYPPYVAAYGHEDDRVSHSWGRGESRAEALAAAKEHMKDTGSVIS